MQKLEARLSIGDLVVIKKNGRMGFDVVVRLGFRKSAGDPVKPCRQVRWANIRTGRARAVLGQGLMIWGRDIDPVYRDTSPRKPLTTG